MTANSTKYVALILVTLGIGFSVDTIAFAVTLQSLTKASLNWFLKLLSHLQKRIGKLFHLYKAS